MTKQQGLIHFTRHWSSLLSYILCSLLLTLTANSQTIEAVRVQTPPTIDGNLDDACWQNVKVTVDKFKIAELEMTPPDQTQAHIGFDDEALYIGFRCTQDENSIIANQTRRDGSFQYEDHIAVYLDTYHDRIRSYCFAVNPLGIQRDEKQGDLGWDGEWFAAAIVQSSVWSVEMRIPYDMLDVPQTEKQTWGLNLARRHQSRDRTSIWADTGVNVSDANRFGNLTNLTFRPQRIGRNIQLGGYLSATSEEFSTSTANFSDGLTAAVGGDVAYKLTTSTSVISTLNPDFQPYRIGSSRDCFIRHRTTVNRPSPLLSRRWTHFSSTDRPFLQPPHRRNGLRCKTHWQNRTRLVWIDGSQNIR